MHIKRRQAIEVENSGTCVVREYRFPSESLSFCISLIDGRYPETGRVANTACEEIYYVISGSGAIHSEKGDFTIGPGDLYHFEKEERFWIEGEKLSLAVTNVPKWRPEQHVLVQ
jgi:mannose-6-phosphate isomerase-like protein (cupin superfamily)